MATSNDDLQNDYLEALSIIVNGMIRRGLKISQIHANLSNFVCYVERVYRHHCFNGGISLDDLKLCLP